jgi:predicted permease
VISHEFWQRWFGGAPDALRRQLVVGENAWTIVGIMPSRFEVPNTPADLWVPLVTNLADDRRFAHTLRVVGRTTPPADAAAVTRDLDGVAAQLALERPASNRGWSVTVLPLFDFVVSPEFRRSLWIIAGAVLFVLMMAGTSVAGLLLTRAASRQRELAVRVTLGASRGSLVRLLLLECLVLSVAAGIIGLLLAYWGVALLPSIGAATIPRLDEVAVSGRVFAFAAATTMLAALAAGVLPAWRSTGSLHEMLRSRGAASEPVSARTLHLLVVVEVTSAVMLVIGAGLLVQTVVNLQRRDLGFDAGALLAVNAIWPSSEGENLVGRTERALSRVAGLPGVRDVAAASALPFSGQNSGNTFEIEGRQAGPSPSLPDDFRVSPILPDDAHPFTTTRGCRRDGLTHGAVIVSDGGAAFRPGRHGRR